MQGAATPVKHAVTALLPPPGEGSVRVCTWNVRSLRDDAAGVAAVLRALSPDVAVLQEAPRLLLWPWFVWRLARRSGLRRSVGGGTACGNLLLVSDRVRVQRSQALRLPRRRGLHRRGAVLAVLTVADGAVAVLGTHLDLEAGARLDSARQLRLLADAFTVSSAGAPPLIVGADVNDEPGSAAWAALATGLHDLGRELGPTFPQRAPRRRIDALLADPVLHPDDAYRPQCGPVTDHLPIVADLALPGRR